MPEAVAAPPVTPAGQPETKLQTPPTPAPEQKPADSKPPEVDPRADDPVHRGMMASFDIILGDPATAPPPIVEKPRFKPSTGRTIAQVMAAEKDREEAEKANPTPAADPGPQTPENTAKTPENGGIPKETTPAAPGPTPIEVERRPPVDKLIEQTVKKTLEATAAAAVPAPAAPSTPAPPATDPFEAALSEAEREELNFARWAAEKYPQHSEYPQRVLAYLKSAQAKIEADLKENPNRTFDESNEEFQAWKKKNAPAMPPSERKRLERQQMQEAVSADLRKEKDGEMTELRRQTKMATVLPQIRQETAEHLQKIESDLVQDANSLAAPVIARAREIGWDKVVQEDQIFAPIVRSYEASSAKYATEMRMIMEGVKPFDQNNADHVWIYNFVKGNSEFVTKDETRRVRNGKTFLNRLEYNDAVAKDPRAADRNWTFADQELLDLLSQNTKHNIESALKNEHERLTKSGFARQPAPAPAPSGKNGVPGKESGPPKAGNTVAAINGAPAPVAPPAPASPRATPSAAPGAIKPDNGLASNPYATGILQTLNILPK